MTCNLGMDKEDIFSENGFILLPTKKKQGKICFAQNITKRSPILNFFFNKSA